jgi:hypothetical protein
VRNLAAGELEELLFRIAEDLAQAAVHADEAPVHADVRHARAGELEGAAKARLALLQARLGLALLRDVADGRDQAVEAAFVVAPQERGVHREPGDRAVGAPDADDAAALRLAGAQGDARRALVLAQRRAVLLDAGQERGEAIPAEELVLG